ncbi:MAG: hypothetical protein ACXVNM_03570 [Bacteroidia bacterium]
MCVIKFNRFKFGKQDLNSLISFSYSAPGVLRSLLQDLSKARQIILKPGDVNLSIKKQTAKKHTAKKPLCLRTASLLLIQTKTTILSPLKDLQFLHWHSKNDL